MVADDERDVARQLAALVAIEQIDQAMVVLRDEQRDAVRQRGQLQPPAHRESLGQRGELARELRGIEGEVRQVPFDAHEEQLALRVLVLVGVEDVGVVPVQELADGGDDAFAVRAIDQQDGSVLHDGPRG